MTYFFKQKFSLPSEQLGSIFFVTSIVSAASTLCAASIARRIGNVKVGLCYCTSTPFGSSFCIQTMVFTHLPSAVCLSLIPIPSSLALSLVFLIGRACTQSMDVAPRSAFLAAALPPEHRTAMMGLINVVKTCSTSIGPFVTGALAERGLFWISFTTAGVLKAAYDIGMLLTFAGTE
jgi:sugar phosphate permease